MSIGVIQIKGSVARDIDRLMGRLPALDRAIQGKFPQAQQEIGGVMVGLAKRYVQVQEGEVRSGIGFDASGGWLRFHVLGIPHAAALEFGYKGRELVQAHKRRIGQMFGRVLNDPRTLEVRTHVREQAKPARPFFFRAYFDSFRAMFGILNRVIGEAQTQVGLDG